MFFCAVKGGLPTSFFNFSKLGLNSKIDLNIFFFFSKFSFEILRIQFNSKTKDNKNDPSEVFIIFAYHFSFYSDKSRKKKKMKPNQQKDLIEEHDEKKNNKFKEMSEWVRSNFSLYQTENVGDYFIS